MTIQHIASTERAGFVKWLGKTDVELVYSYNGTHWIRTSRRPFISRESFDDAAIGEIYGGKFLPEKSGALRIYSCVRTGEHNPNACPEGFAKSSSIAVHRLREDGFCYLEPKSGYGYLTTRCVLPKDANLRLNYLAPNGKVWCQLSDQNYKPLDGYSFEDCVPLTGDEVSATPRWKTKTLEEIPGKYLDPAGRPAHLLSPDLLNREDIKYLRLEFKLFQARLYAVHWNCCIKYGDAIIEEI